MALRIEIKSTSTGEQTLTPKPGASWTGFTKISQTAYIHGMVDQNGAPEAYPVRVSIDLGSKEKGFRPAYAVGNYEIADSSFFVGKFDDLQLGRLVLVPIALARSPSAS